MSFQIGDKCELVYCYFPENAHLVGTTCVVDGRLERMYSPKLDKKIEAHWCVFENGQRSAATPSQLRKIDDDNPNQATSWQDCIWSPARERA